MKRTAVITGATCDLILDDPLVNRFFLDVMVEGRIGARIGCPIEQSGEERMAVIRKRGMFKTSMCRTLKRGGQWSWMPWSVLCARSVRWQVRPTPNIDVLLGLARLHARVRGLYPWSLARS